MKKAQIQFDGRIGLRDAAAAGRRGFTLIELLVAFGIISMLIALLLPALGLARRSWRQTQGGTQLRSIHEAIVARAASNNGSYVGLAKDGYTVLDATVEGRFKTLIDEKLIPPKHLISPVEDLTPWTSGALLPENYSFNMLSIKVPGARREEWRGGTSPMAAILSDRVIDNGAGSARSIHTWPGEGVEDWRGSVCWNDGHISWELERYAPTAYANAQNNNDNFFIEASPHDALLLHEGE